MKAASKPKFVYRSYIATTPEKLWQALTSPEFTSRYWGNRTIHSVWEEGAPVEMRRKDGGHDWHGEVLRFDPPRTLAYTFCVRPGGEGAPELRSRVTFELKPLGETVMLTVTHEDFEPDDSLLESISHGWPAILSSLKSLLETGSPLEYGAWEEVCDSE